MLRLLIAAFCALALLPKASAQQFDFSGTAAQDPAILSTAVTNLAIEVLPVYKEADRETYLTNLAALQAAAGRYNQAAQSYEALRDFRRSAHISNAWSSSSSRPTSMVPSRASIAADRALPASLR